MEHRKDHFLKNAVSLFDNSVREALEDVTGGLLSDWAW